MNIGMVCYPTFGGSGIVAAELGNELSRRGHHIHFISYDVPARIFPVGKRIFFHEVKVFAYPLFQYPPYSLALATKIAEVAEHEKLDLVHVHYAIPHAISALLARDMLRRKKISLKVITTLHGTDITLVGNDRSYLEVTRYGIELSDTVTAVSQYLRQVTLDTFAIATPIEVIGNFLPRDILQQAAGNGEPWFPTDPTAKVLVHISNFRPVKRIEDVLAIFFKVRDRLPAKLVFVGDGPERSKAEEICRERNACCDVLFLGKQANVAEILNSAHLLLLPSASESFGLVALEAMGCGVPVIGTNAGGLPEVVTHGATGFLSPIGDVNSMAANALRLLGNEDLRRAMGEAGHRVAREQFSPDSIVNLYEQLYRRLLIQ
jgi:N-acetyl-alpha-D-glucosaminyl L-malate synthase BshA